MVEILVAKVLPSPLTKNLVVPPEDKFIRKFDEDVEDVVKINPFPEALLLITLKANPVVDDVTEKGIVDVNAVEDMLKF